MAKDPAFLFYPGDYVRDTQCMSANVQVAYDRIMCEHMRNICITQQQLNFFTKRLSVDEKEEMMTVLIKIKGGFQIEWVAESIEKRRDYSKSRSNNRKGKGKNQPVKEITYDHHMEIEDEIEIEDVNKDEVGIIFPFQTENFKSAWIEWRAYKESQHKFKFKSIKTEQTALNELLKLSKGVEYTALEIIQKSIANGWKGFFELKENGTRQTTNDKREKWANYFANGDNAGNNG